MKNIIPSIEVSNKNKIPVPTIKKKNWAFSFQYFDQMPHFGLDIKKVDTQWYFSFLERLKDLCKKCQEDFLKDTKEMKYYRYHPINWNSTNIPIQRKDINWLDKDIRDNDIEFPFFQFMLSKATGRIVGFWNEDGTVFNIVLLDPMHNIQPSKKNNYNVFPTREMKSKYSELLKNISDLKEINCSHDCGIAVALSKISEESGVNNIVYLYLDDTYTNLLGKYSMTKIVEAGLTMLEID
ncbi:MAG: hypothetical protein QM743_08805 [Chitinophagaceae bacterium]